MNPTSYGVATSNPQLKPILGAMAYTLSAATEADIPALGPITYAAFQNDPQNMTSRFFPGVHPSAVQRWRIRQLSTAFQDKSYRFVKITEGTNKRIVAYARWQFPHPRKDNEGNKHDDELNESSLPEGANVRLMKAFGKAVDDKRAELMNVEKDYCSYPPSSSIERLS